MGWVGFLLGLVVEFLWRLFTMVFLIWIMFIQRFCGCWVEWVLIMSWGMADADVFCDLVVSDLFGWLWIWGEWGIKVGLCHCDYWLLLFYLVKIWFFEGSPLVGGCVWWDSKWDSKFKNVGLKRGVVSLMYGVGWLLPEDPRFIIDEVDVWCW